AFRHPPPAREIARRPASVRRFPERSPLVGVSSLGKAQRVLSLLRAAGYAEPVFIHGALAGCCDLYRTYGINLGPTEPVTGRKRDELRGRIVMAPPSATADIWARRMPDPVVAHASGWMRVRQRARQRLVELPLVISDHADWDELIQTVEEVGAPKVWVTHGAEEGMVHWCRQHGYDAQALSLVGRDEEEE